MTQSLLAFDDGVPVGSQVSLSSNDRGVLSGLAVSAASVISPSTLLGQTKFVAKNGNDATADGSVALPFLTIQAAISSIGDASSSKPYVVVVMAGVYTETFACAPWIYVQGISPLAVYLNPVTANWISAGFAAGTQDSGISDVTLLTNLTVNFATVGSAGAGTFKFSNCILGSAVALSFTGNNVGNVVQLQNLLSIGPTSSTLTLASITSNAGSVNLRNGNLTITGTDAYACQHRFESVSTGGTISVTWTGAAANGLFVTFYTPSAPLNPTTFAISGARAQVTTHGPTQVTGPNADTTFSFGNVPNGGTVILLQTAENTIVANPNANRTYTLEGGGLPGTRVRIINQAAGNTITVAYAGGASGPAVVVAAASTVELYASTAVVWNLGG